MSTRNLIDLNGFIRTEYYYSENKKLPCTHWPLITTITIEKAQAMTSFQPVENIQGNFEQQENNRTNCCLVLIKIVALKSSMTLQPLLSASPVIQFHTLAAFLALGLGAFQLYARKGGQRHRMTGYIWASLMMLIALSSFFINHIRMIGPFSPIHILSIVTLIGVPRAILAARRGNYAAHQRGMKIVFWSALVGAGLFTLLPERIMGQVFFGS